MNQLESALTIVLRQPLNWESAIVDDSGTLAPVNPASAIDCTTYQQRDRVLAYRDLLLGAAVVEVSVQVGDVWNYSAVKPTLQGPANVTLPFNGTEAGQVNSLIRHVTNVSVPYDAARYADADLYGRDALAYEVLARACQSTFLDPAIAPVDSTGTVITSTSVWSLGQGAPAQADINAALPLNRDLFKVPDCNLADRDNQLAGYVAQLAQVLKNPFANALRLYVEITSNGTVQQEPDVYALVSADGTNRVFQTEPALPGANQIVYNVPNQTLQWLSTNIDTVHVPQIYAMSVPGIQLGQAVSTLAKIPDERDSQYWRSKAGQLQPDGIRVTDTALALRHTVDATLVSGGVMQADTASFTVPDQMTFLLNGSLPVGNCRISALVEPSNQVKLAGIHNYSNTSGTLGGATFDINVPSGNITSKTYVVESGDGIVYNGIVYLPGETFTGTNIVPTYSQYGGTPSAVRQYALTYQLALPPGAWDFSVEYTNISGSTNGFTLSADYAAVGAAPVIVLQDVAPLPFNVANGELLLTPKAGMDVANNGPFKFSLYWTGGSGQLHVRSLTFNNAETLGHYQFTGSFCGSTAAADVYGQSGVPGVLRWQVFNSGTLSGNVPLTISRTDESALPIQLQQVQVQALDYYPTTPFSSSFQAWRQECLDRAARNIAENYAQAVNAYGTGTPSFRDSGSNWSPAATENWMSFVEVYNPRLRAIPNVTGDTPVVGRQYAIASTTGTYNGTVYTAGQSFYGVANAGTYNGDSYNQIGAFIKSSPGHVGRPALVPNGLYFDDIGGTVAAYYDTPQSPPKIMACQPWMIQQGIYVAQAEFWQPEGLGETLPVLPAPTSAPPPPTDYVALRATVHPTGAGVVSGLGTFPVGSAVTLSVTPGGKGVNGYVDVVFIIDESGSMGLEWATLAAFQAWIGTAAANLESALNGVGIGTTTPNRYALMGFGAGAGGAAGGRPAWLANQPHILNVGSGTPHDWGTAANMASAASSQITNNTGGGIEDGYVAMDFALQMYAYRAGATKVFILVTDETRDDIITGHYISSGMVTNGTHTYTFAGDVTQSSITAELLANKVVLATLNKINMTAAAGGTVIGASGVSVGSPAFIVTRIPPLYYSTSTLASIANGDTTTENAYKDVSSSYYWNVAAAVGGTVWNINNVSAYVSSFTSAFVDQTKQSILMAQYYTFNDWVINSGTYATNPVGITVADPTTIDVYLT